MITLASGWTVIGKYPFNENPSLAFKVYVQAVDEYLSGYSDSLIDCSSKKTSSVAKVTVTVTSVKYKNISISSDTSFIEKIISDFDAVDWSQLKRCDN